MDEKRWRRERDRAVAVRAAALERQVAAEVARARELVARFATEARERGLRTTPLVARPYHGPLWGSLLQMAPGACSLSFAWKRIDTYSERPFDSGLG